jgi:hypothetical protein
MSITGVAATSDPRLEWTERRAWLAPSPVAARQLSAETLLAKVADAEPGTAPTGVTLQPGPAPVPTFRLDGHASSASVISCSRIGNLSDRVTGELSPASARAAVTQIRLDKASPREKRRFVRSIGWSPSVGL